MGYQVVVPEFDILETNGLLEIWQAGPERSRCGLRRTQVHPIGLGSRLFLLGHLMDLIRPEERK